jgi:hypothetical protein
MERLPGRIRVPAVLTLALAAVASVPGTAAATWSVRGSGGGTAATASLTPPDDVRSECGLLTVGASSLTVSFVPPADGAPLERFDIARSVDDGLTWQLAGSVTAAGRTTVVFEDRGLTLLTTYRYRVFSVRGEWRAAAEAPPRTLVLGALGLVNVCI